MNDSIIKELKQLADSNYKEFHSKLCPNTKNILGVRLPKQREIAKRIAKGNWQEFLENVQNKYYEETMIEGLVIGYIKLPLQEKLHYIQNFVNKIDNWAVCDSFCSNLKIKQADQELMWQFLEKCRSSNDEFILRFVVVMYLNYYLTDDCIDHVLSNIDKMDTSSYYISMGIAWAISIAYIKQKEKTQQYLIHSNLDKVTYNKAIQKMIESYRITIEEKEKLRKLKK